MHRSLNVKLYNVTETNYFSFNTRYILFSMPPLRYLSYCCIVQRFILNIKLHNVTEPNYFSLSTQCILFSIPLQYFSYRCIVQRFTLNIKLHNFTKVTYFPLNIAFHFRSKLRWEIISIEPSAFHKCTEVREPQCTTSGLLFFRGPREATSGRG